MLIYLSDISSQEDKVSKYHIDLELSQIEISGVSYPLAEKQPLSLILTNIGKKKVKLEGEIELTVQIPCGRCLSDVPYPMHLAFQKEIDLNKSEQDRIEELDEHNFLTGYDLDAEKLVYGEVLVSWPMKVLCSESCKGMCNRCGTNLNLASCSCEPTDLDPRMAAIRDVFSKFKEV